jgi:tRNA1(Val) A37 N6-methylase TrmN6
VNSPNELDWPRLLGLGAGVGIAGLLAAGRAAF